MPIYEYECQACGHRTEVLQGFRDEPRSECDECSGELKRLVSAPAVQFKGTGWYVTDYAGRKGSDEPSAQSAKNSKEGSEKSKEPKAAADSSGSSSEGASE